jgi:hypothetical protein
MRDCCLSHSLTLWVCRAFPAPSQQAALLREHVRLLTATGSVQRTHIRAGQHQSIKVLIAEDLMHHRLGVADMGQAQSVSKFMGQDKDEIGEVLILIDGDLLAIVFALMKTAVCAIQSVVRLHLPGMRLNQCLVTLLTLARSL